MPKTFLTEQFEALEKTDNFGRSHTINVWRDREDGSFHATCNSHGGYVTKKKHKTPEAAIKHAMVAATLKRD